MRSALLFCFWLATIWLFYVYVGYPLLLWLIGLRRPFRPIGLNAFLPKVSVLISARNEERDIGWKLVETLNWDYPVDRIELLVASDASDDSTDEIIASVSDPRLKFIRMEKRVGKNAALNHLSRLATGDLFFFTDANSHIDGNCLRRIVRHFADARVGCVTGKDLTVKHATQNAITMGETSYWGYESLLQSLESRIGSTLICFGAIFCIRRELFVPLQSDLANDLELPVRIAAAGFRILFEPRACSVEKATSSPREEFKRRRRICGQGFLAFWRLRKCLQGLRAWQFLSRKFLRWMCLVPLVLLLISSARLSAIPAFRLLFATQAIFYTLALLGWLSAKVGRQGSAVVAIPFYFVLVNLAAIVGIVEVCLGRRYQVWEVASLTRGPEVSSAD